MAVLYRQIPQEAEHSPVDPWPGRGRFGDGTHLVLYLSSTATGAIAEFLRRHPEFLELQDRLRIQLFRIEMLVDGNTLNLRGEACRERVGISLASLTSSDANEDVRYEDCRVLARKVATVAIGLCSPSAAIQDGTWTLALFNEPEDGEWRPANHIEEDRPFVEPSHVQLFSSA